MNSRWEEIIHFWFQDLSDDRALRSNLPPANQWFAADAGFDRRIRDNFSDDLKKAGCGEYEDWKKTIRGRLGLVLLYDQFTRNIFRNTPRMCENDLQAQSIVVRTLEDGTERTLFLFERIFFYMPLMHAEDIHLQERSVRFFENLVEESRLKSPLNTGYFEHNLKYAREHFQTIERFGRFPHRNAFLQRTNTEAEEEFLGSSLRR